MARYTDRQIAQAILKCGSITKASEDLHINRCTLSKRAHSENVQKLVHEMREELFSASCSRLIQATEKAISVLLETMCDEQTSPGQRIRCAELLLVNAFRSYEVIDLSDDLRQLRKEFQEIKERGN